MGWLIFGAFATGFVTTSTALFLAWSMGLFSETELD